MDWIGNSYDSGVWPSVCKNPFHPSHTLSTCRSRVTASHGRSMASSARPVGHSSKWSCETLREGYQHVLKELETAEKQAEREIAESRLMFLLTSKWQFQHQFQDIIPISKTGSYAWVYFPGTECDSPSYKEIRGGWPCKNALFVALLFCPKNRVVTNHPICSQWKFSISGRPSCSLWSQLGNASGSGLSDSSLDSWTTAARRLAQASPGAIERSLGRNPPQVDVMQLESSVTHPVIEVPDDSQIPKVGWFVPS